jgi:alkanesulfonate monooxygenase SsuD/methylene tetrahydromethanopterin reductase-like flavin-dependent oxidoreductase (luciferase family)
MQLGVNMFNTDYSIRIDELAREVEARGFESLWVPEHTHIPKSRKSPWPGGPNLPNLFDMKIVYRPLACWNSPTG